MGPAALDGFVVLDPSVAVEELPARSPSMWSQQGPVRRGWLVVHGALETAAVVPAGRGMQEFVDQLRAPVAIGELVDAGDVAGRTLAWQLLEGLLAGGYAHRVAAARAPADAELAELRAGWRARCGHARRTVAAADTGSPGELAARLRALGPAPSLVLASSGRPGFLEELAAAYAGGGFRAHDVVVELAAAPPPGRALPACLHRLRAAVRLPARELAAIRALAADCVPVIARAELAADPPDQLARALVDARATALELALDWSRITGDRLAAVDAAIAGLRADLGDVAICGWPSDDEIAQHALRDRPAPRSPVERDARARHVRDRALHLLALEGKVVWGQDPAAEELWVPRGDDLLPNRPELLGIGPGSFVVDVGGGFGRVARRLAGHVGDAGAVISIEKEPIISGRARRFACELDERAIQFRVALGQRLPLADATVDAAVLEWGGEIHRDALLGRCVAEMARVVRPGRRLAITYRLCNILLERLTEPVAPYPDIYPTLLAAVRRDELTVVAHKFWAVQPRLSGAPVAAFEERYLPRLVDDLAGRTIPAQPPSVDLSVTLIAEKR